jgi:hypothetical protein
VKFIFAFLFKPHVGLDTNNRPQKLISLDELGYAKITQFGHASAIFLLEKYISRLNVSVDDSVAVQE